MSEGPTLSYLVTSPAPAYMSLLSHFGPCLLNLFSNPSPNLITCLHHLRSIVNFNSKQRLHSRLASMATEDVKYPIPDDPQSPLFDPQAAASSLPNSAAPTAPIATGAPEIIELPQLLEDGEHDAVASPFIRRLRDIESNAKAKLSTWSSTDMHPQTQHVTPTSGLGMKRKGMQTSPRFRTIPTRIKLRK